VKARLTPETWRLEVVGDDSSEVARPARLEDGTALDLRTQGAGQGARESSTEAMQCNNIPFPSVRGSGRGAAPEVLRRVGKLGKRPPCLLLGSTRDPDQLFQSSLAFNRCDGVAALGAAAAGGPPTG